MLRPVHGVALSLNPAGCRGERGIHHHHGRAQFLRKNAGQVLGVFREEVIERQGLEHGKAPRRQFVDHHLGACHLAEHGEATNTCGGLQEGFSGLHVGNPVGQVGIGRRGGELLELVHLCGALGLRRQHGQHVLVSADDGDGADFAMLQVGERHGFDDVLVHAKLYGIVGILRRVDPLGLGATKRTVRHQEQFLPGDRLAAQDAQPHPSRQALRRRAGLILLGIRFLLGFAQCGRKPLLLGELHGIGLDAHAEVLDQELEQVFQRLAGLDELGQGLLEVRLGLGVGFLVEPGRERLDLASAEQFHQAGQCGVDPLHAQLGGFLGQLGGDLGVLLGRAWKLAATPGEQRLAGLLGGPGPGLCDLGGEFVSGLHALQGLPYLLERIGRGSLPGDPDSCIGKTRRQRLHCPAAFPHHSPFLGAARRVGVIPETDCLEGAIPHVLGFPKGADVMDGRNAWDGPSNGDPIPACLIQHGQQGIHVFQRQGVAFRLGRFAWRRGFRLLLGGFRQFSGGLVEQGRQFIVGQGRVFILGGRLVLGGQGRLVVLLCICFGISEQQTVPLLLLGTLFVVLLLAHLLGNLVQPADHLVVCGIALVGALAIRTAVLGIEGILCHARAAVLESKSLGEVLEHGIEAGALRSPRVGECAIALLRANLSILNPVRDQIVVSRASCLQLIEHERLECAGQRLVVVRPVGVFRSGGFQAIQLQGFGQVVSGSGAVPLRTVAMAQRIFGVFLRWRTPADVGIEAPSSQERTRNGFPVLLGMWGALEQRLDATNHYPGGVVVGGRLGIHAAGEVIQRMAPFVGHRTIAPRVGQVDDRNGPAVRARMVR